LNTRKVTLRVLPGPITVVRLSPRARAPEGLIGFHSVTRTDKELSVVCRQNGAPRGGRRENGFRCLEVAGPIAFGAIGVLASIADPLARARIPILAISTFDTDYVLVREKRLPAAIRVLEGAGHSVRVE
jgi:uncharacterized protein